MAFESNDGRNFTRSGKFKRGNNGSFDTDLEDARIAEANARHDAEMKRLGRGFLQQTQNAMGARKSREETDAETQRLVEASGRPYRLKRNAKK